MGPKLRVVEDDDPHPTDRDTSLLFGNALDVVPFPCLRIDDRGVVLALNTAAAEFLGVNPQRRVSCVVSAFLAPGHATAFFQFIGRIVRTNQAQRCTIPVRSQTGAERVVQFDARREGPSSTLLSLIDVSEREYALTRLRSSEQRMRSLLEALPDAVFVVDGGMVVHCNPAAYRIAPMPPVGRAFASLLEPEQCPLLAGHAMGMPNQPERHELCFGTADGPPRSVETLWMPIEFEGRLAHLCVARDRTEQRRLEAQMAHADRLATVGVLAQGVAHELNNPLTFVTMNVRELVDVLESSRPVDTLLRDELAESAREAADGARRMARIVADLQGLARVEGEPAAMDLNAVVERCLVLARAQIRSRVRVHTSLASLPMVHGDEGRMTQVVLNLLINAIQALPDHDGNIWVETRFDGDDAVLEVRDDGPGFASHIRHRVFEPFVTTKPVGDGTGLGLFVCHQYVTECGGTLEALDSAEGGALLRVRLQPASTTDITRAPEPRRPLSPLETPRLLIVDDEPIIRESLARKLAPSVDVEIAGNAEEALDLIRTGRRFDIILCDLMMPGRGARWLYNTVESEFPEALRSFCVMTGGAVEREDARFLNETSPPLLRKPFSSADVSTFVRTRLETTLTAPHESRASAPSDTVTTSHAAPRNDPAGRR